MDNNLIQFPSKQEPPKPEQYDDIQLALIAELGNQEEVFRKLLVSASETLEIVNAFLRAKNSDLTIKFQIYRGSVSG